MDEKFDVIIIGGGPAGYVAAIRASQLKLKVALIEREHLGGVCLNWGCIPTKALLKISEMVQTCKNAKHYGINIGGEISFDIAKMVKYSRDVSQKLASGVEKLMLKNKVTVIKAEAKLSGQGGVSVTTLDNKQQKLAAKHIIIATGASPRQSDAIKVDGQYIWNYRHAMVPESLPKKLLIIGSGAIGIEFASFYNLLGVEVTIMEVAERILTNEDAEVSSYVQKVFEKRGIKIATNTKVTGSKIVSNEVNVEFIRNNQTHNEVFDRVILAIGVVANTQNIGLESTKVKLERGSIKTNSHCETDEPKVHAVGDVASAPWLAHKASHEAILCVEKIAGLPVKPINVLDIPSCTYSYPQIASFGMNEAVARQKCKNVKIGNFPLYANGKAIAIDKTDGFVKTIFDGDTGELLGAHLVGADVTEMIQGLLIAKNLEATEEDLMHTIFPHPTISEAIHESVLSAWGKTLHL